LRRRLVPDLNEPLVSQPPQQREQVVLTVLGLDLILREENVPAVTHRPRLLDQVPDPSPYLVWAVVHPGHEVQDGHLLTEVARDLLLIRHSSRML
jgi:hypothetical protein